MKKIILLITLIGVTLAIISFQKETGFANSPLGKWPFQTQKATIDLSDKELTHLNEQKILEHYADLSLKCAPEPSDLGERVCYQNINTFNDIPAQTIALFLIDDTLAHITVIFPSSSQPDIIEYLNKKFVFINNLPKGAENVNGAAAWITSSGIIAAHPDTKPPPKDARIVWRSYDSLSANKNSTAIRIMKLAAESKNEKLEKQK